MTIDLWLLVWAVLLALAQMGIASTLAKTQTGIAYSIGPRDRPFELTGMAGRMERAYRNLLESLPMFATLVLVVHVSGQANDWSALGAHLYFWGRLAYLPAYAVGLPWLRTVIWQIAMIGLVIILLQLFL
ncbi:MAG: MAPEG family protein [Alphaproteobacteria bacterium]|nr:MAPEG family protein [Alphaproteobacteria bacterium]MDP6565578.1 MAPEG family protein [Alphaproteobacteria bacterium]MDP6815668.1 MAPEG family protein [Alphaproteobacteria bacterium]